MNIIVTIPKETPLKKFQKIRENVKKKLAGPINRKIVEQYDSTVVGWTKKPKFVGTVTEPRGEIWLTVKPTGPGTLNWARVDQGTGPRSIVSSKGPMIFPRFYMPRTWANGSWGNTPQRFGPIVKTYKVQRHRIQPREFSKKILARLEGQIQSELERAIK